jgi:hypothetical protein
MGSYDNPSSYALQKLERANKKKEPKPEPELCRALKGRMDLYAWDSATNNLSGNVWLDGCNNATTDPSGLCGCHRNHTNGVVGDISIVGVKCLQNLIRHVSRDNTEWKTMLDTAEDTLRNEASAKHDSLSSNGDTDLSSDAHLAVERDLNIKIDELWRRAKRIRTSVVDTVPFTTTWKGWCASLSPSRISTGAGAMPSSSRSSASTDLLDSDDESEATPPVPIHFRDLKH